MRSSLQRPNISKVYTIYQEKEKNPSEHSPCSPPPKRDNIIRKTRYTLSFLKKKSQKKKKDSVITAATSRPGMNTPPPLHVSLIPAPNPHSASMGLRHARRSARVVFVFARALVRAGLGLVCLTDAGFAGSGAYTFLKHTHIYTEKTAICMLDTPSFRKIKYNAILKRSFQRERNKWKRPHYI